MAHMMAAAEAMPMPDDIRVALGYFRAIDVPETDKSHVDATVHFLDMILQLQRQSGIAEQAKEQTEAVTLECSLCHTRYAFDSAAYAQEGKLYACAEEHAPRVMGSMPGGVLTEGEVKAQSGGADVITVNRTGQVVPNEHSES